jgi:hypothetical protein
MQFYRIVNFLSDHNFRHREIFAACEIFWLVIFFKLVKILHMRNFCGGEIFSARHHRVNAKVNAKMNVKVNAIFKMNAIS